MNRQALRSACAWVRPEIGQPISNYFRSFSTTPSWQADEVSSGNNNNNSGAATGGGGATPSSPRRQRTAAATNEIRSLVTDRPSKTATAAATDGAPRIVDVKALPRGGLRGRGGFRGRVGAFSRPGMPSTGGASPTGVNRFAGARGGVQGRGRGTGRGRGGRGGRGRGGRKTQSDSDPMSKEMLLKKREKELDSDLFVDQEEKEFDDAIRFGTRTRYNPEVTLESLLAHMPAVASKSAHKPATALENLNYLGTGDHVATSLDLQASSYGASIQEGGIRYFADPASIQRTETYLQDKRHADAVAKAIAATPEGAEPPTVERNNEPIISGVEESIKQVILDQAIAGKHEAMKYGEDPVTITRNWHLRNETWTGRQSAAFEKKLVELLSKATVTPTTGKGPTASK